MPTLVTAVLQVRVNGGSPQTGGIVVNASDVIQLVAQSYAGWGAPAPRWEILSYPPSWPTPAGWTLDTTSGVIYYLGTTPPSFTLPNAAAVTSGLFGVWRFGLTVNGGTRTDLIDKNRTAVEIIADTGIRDIAYGERSEFDSKFAHASKLATNNRLVDGIIAGSFTLGSSTPSVISSTTGSAGASPNASHDDHTHQLTESVFRAVSATLTAALSVNGQKITSLGTPTDNTDAVTKAYADGLVTFDVIANIIANSAYELTFNGFSLQDIGPPQNATDATTRGYEDEREWASSYKVFARGASLANQSLSGALTEDGVTYQTGDIYLAKNQSTGSQNGLYVVNTFGAWTRHFSMIHGIYVLNGAIVGVREGTTNGGTGWFLSTAAPITIGTTALTFTKVWNPAYTIGNGLELSGLTLAVKAAADGSITVGAGGVGVGVLASDAQHGVRGGGTQHALAVAGSPGTAGFIGGVDIQAVQSRTADATSDTMMLRNSDGGTKLAYLSSKPSGLLNPASALGLIRALNQQTIIAVRDQADGDDLELFSFNTDSLIVGSEATHTDLSCEAGGTTTISVKSVEMIVAADDGMGFFGAGDFAGGEGVLTINGCTTIPSTTLTGDKSDVYVDDGAIYAWAPDNLRVTIAPKVTGDTTNLTRVDRLVARKNQAIGNTTETLLSIPLGHSSAISHFSIVLLGKFSGTTFARRRFVVLNNQVGGNIVVTDTIGTDFDDIGGGVGAAFVVSSGNYNIDVTGSTSGAVRWTVEVDILYSDNAGP